MTLAVPRGVDAVHWSDTDVDFCGLAIGNLRDDPFSERSEAAQPGFDTAAPMVSAPSFPERLPYGI
jgi:hypothetical protein